jgi:hypothetical protein
MADEHSLVALPDIRAPPDSPAHVQAFAEYRPGDIVLALYPGTTCFYRAKVVGHCEVDEASMRARVFLDCSTC